MYNSNCMFTDLKNTISNCYCDVYILLRYTFKIPKKEEG
jgi:hypothetical protein